MYDQMVTLYGSVTTSSKYSLDKAGGFLQRMVLCSKYAFGKMPVIGSETPFKLKGL
jgi:elongation factor 1-gamma